VALPQARLSLAELTRAHLLSEPVPGRYGCHDLLRAHAAELALETDRDGAQRQAALHRLLEHYVHTAHTADQLINPHRDPLLTQAPMDGVTPEELTTHAQALAWFTAEHTVLLAAVRQGLDGGFDRHAWQLAWTLTAFLQRTGRWRDWAATQSHALTAAQRLADRPGQAHAHRHLGRAYGRLGQHEEAQGQYERALAIYREVGDCAGQANTHLGLRWLHEIQGNGDQALRHAEQSLELYLSTPDLAGQARGLNAVGWHHILRGEYEHALTFCQRALALNQEIGEREGQAETWDSIGYAHHHLGRHRQAIECYAEATALYEVLGDQFGASVVQQHIGDAHLALADPDAARLAWQQALEILDELRHPDAEQVRAKLRELGGPAGAGTGVGSTSVLS
jgi:tetratricopeptide (TPR) repeat protein